MLLFSRFQSKSVLQKRRGGQAVFFAKIEFFAIPAWANKKRFSKAKKPVFAESLPQSPVSRPPPLREPVHFRRKWYNGLYHFSRGEIVRKVQITKERYDKMNMQKVQTHSVFRILDHNGRSDSDRSRNRKNENIDPTRSHLNYNLAAKDQPMLPYEYFLKRKNEVYAHGNASVGIVSWVITKPKTLPENETEDFFKAAYEFFEKKHGKENVVSAYVHMDETTPHLHFCFVPVVVDEKKGEKLCAKSVTTKRY